MKASKQGNPVMDCAFPGGNIIVEKIENDKVFLHQDLRDTTHKWFYWYFRVREAGGRALTFCFTKSKAIGVRGPACSEDEGKTWKWLGTDCTNGNSFTHIFPTDIKETRFSFGMPYQQSRLIDFLRCHAHNSRLRKERLCRTRKGRVVERLHLGCLHRQPKYRVLLTCRHHCCEMMASYTLEGIMETILSDSDESKWFADNVEFLVIPFMDKDGVEDGAQGLHRVPHCYNRDYGENGNIYPSVRALREFVPKWSEQRLRLALDSQRRNDIRVVWAV